MAATRHPQHSPPTLRWRPERVHGMPVDRPILDFADEMPVSRFQEKPPKLGRLYSFPP